MKTWKLQYSWLNIIIIKYSNKYYEWISKTSDSTIKHIYKIYIHIMISRTLKLLLYKNPNMQALNIYSYVMFENSWPTSHLHVYVGPGGIWNGYIGRLVTTHPYQAETHAAQWMHMGEAWAQCKRGY